MVLKILVGLLIVLFVLNVVEIIFKVPLISTIIGLVLVLLFDYPQIRSEGNVLVYEAPEEIFVANFRGKKFRVIPLMVNASAITIGNVIIVSRKYCSAACVDLVLKHELVHVEQYKRYGSLVFFMLYIGWYFYNLLKYSREYCKKYKSNKKTCLSFLSQKAYEEVPFEIEAREKSRIR